MDEVELVDSTVVSVELVVPPSVVLVVSSVDVVSSVVDVVVTVGRGLGAAVVGLVGAGMSSADPGPIGSLAPVSVALGAISGPLGLVVLVVDEDDGVVSEISTLSLPMEVSTEAALNARGAATITAIDVDSDKASRNRRRPLGSSGRCKYIQIWSRLGLHTESPHQCFTRIVRSMEACGINSPASQWPHVEPSMARM